MTNSLTSIDMLDAFSAIEQQAAHWFLTMQQPEVSAEDKAAFIRWLKTSPTHQSEYFRLRKLWQALPAALAKYETEVEVTSEKIPPPKKPTINTNKKSTLLPRWLYASAACLSLLAFLLNPWSSPLPVDYYHTKAGEIKLLTLSDGSTIKLNTQSKVSVHYSDEQRLIRLINGEAYFVVAKAQDRPFIVKHNQYQFTALGTEFLLRTANTVQLVVTEHSVAVKDNLGKNTTVKEGFGVRLTKTWQPLAKEKIEQLLAWRKQQLIFSQQPLKQVLAELERYIPGNIHLSDLTMAKEPVTGNFDLSQPDEIIIIISETLGLEVYLSKSGDYFLGNAHSN